MVTLLCHFYPSTNKYQFDLSKNNQNSISKKCQSRVNIIDERYKLKSIIITSQLPTQTWHDYLKNPTLADAILDRLLSQSDKLELTGESLRWDKKEKLAKQ